MDKKQVTDLRSELLDSRFGAKSISTIAESKRFPLTKCATMSHSRLSMTNYILMATLVRTWQLLPDWDDENVHKLMDLSINKNWIDKEEYPQSAAIDLRCVNMVTECGMRLRRKMVRPLAPTPLVLPRPVCWRDGDEMALAQAYGSCRRTNG